MGQYEISDVAKMTCELHSRFGKIVRLGGLIGRPDLLFVNDADEIEKVRTYLQYADLIKDTIILMINLSSSP